MFRRESHPHNANFQSAYESRSVIIGSTFPTSNFFYQTYISKSVDRVDSRFLMMTTLRSQFRHTILKGLRLANERDERIFARERSALLSGDSLHRISSINEIDGYTCLYPLSNEMER